VSHSDYNFRVLTWVWPYADKNRHSYHPQENFSECDKNEGKNSIAVPSVYIMFEAGDGQSSIPSHSYSKWLSH
jgi:hypothetical protein